MPRASNPSTAGLPPIRVGGGAARPNANIVGRYKRKPKVDPAKFVVKKRGGGKGYVTVRNPNYKAPTPGPPPGPYDRYKETAPWAIAGLEQIDRDQAHHQSYVSDKVAPWLSGALQGLQGYQDAAQTAYGNTIRGAGVGAMNVSAGMTPLQAGGLAPGAVQAGNNQYLTEGGSIRAQGMASSMLAESANAERLNKLAPVPFSQGAIQALADYQKNLPQMYVERRRAYTERVDQFVAEMQQAQAELAERERSNRVREAISATNAEANIAIQLGRLGLSAEEFAAERAGQGGPIPEGYTQLPDGRYVRDPTYQAPASPPSGGGGGGGRPSVANKPLSKSQISSMNGRWKGTPNNPPKLGPGWKQPVWDPGTKRWYAKRAAGSGSRSGSPASQENLRQELDKWYFDKIDGKFDPPAASRRVGNWILARKGRFTKNGKADRAAILALLTGVIGGSNVPSSVAAFLDQHVRPDGRWK